MTVDISEVKRLKGLTGVGLTEAKAALDESKGDFDKALKAMRIKGLTKAEKRAEREAREGLIGTYNHDNRIGVLVEVNCETDFVARNDIFKELVKDLCLHIAASNPVYVDIREVSKNEIKKKTEEFSQKPELASKPKDMAKKIVDAQVKKYFEEICLMDQLYVKNPDITVKDLVKEHIAKLGENIVVRRFSRLALGE